MRKPNLKLMAAGAVLPLFVAASALAQDPPTWRQPEPYVTAPAPDYGRSSSARSAGSFESQAQTAPGGYGQPSDVYRPSPPNYGAAPVAPRYNTARNGGSGQGNGNVGSNEVYVMPPRQPGDGAAAPGRGEDAYRPPAAGAGSTGPGYADNSGGYGAPYSPPGQRFDQGEPNGRNGDNYRAEDRGAPGSYSENEIINAGHGFFGSVSKGLAKAIEYVFQQSGRPNGYILGEDAGGAFIAGLRYGEGRLYTKDAGTHKVYWQGPSLGYDFGGEGSKTMVLVYNMRDPSDIYHRYGGVQGSAYLIGGVGVQFQKYGDVVLAPIRSGVGLRLGANVGYLKYTRRPTWNPF